MPIRFSPLALIFLLGCACATAQVEPSAAGGATPEDDFQMMTPPPVSGMPYPKLSASDARSNYLSIGANVTPAYIDNIVPTASSAAVSDFTCSIAPNISLDRTTPRTGEQLAYAPTFTFYDPTSTLDAIDQSAEAMFAFRLTPRISADVHDSFLKTSNVYNESYPFSGPITGTTQGSTSPVIAPFAQQIVDTTNGVLTYQFGRNAMVGGGGYFSIFDLTNPSQALGLDNSHSEGGSAFYNRRLNPLQYAGIAYNYTLTVVDSPGTPFKSQIQAFLPYYAYYFNRTFSVSVSAGIERLDILQAATAVPNSWSPSVVASVGWQGKRGSAAASYAYSLTNGNGLFGVYVSNSISGSGNAKLGRNWTGGVSFSYASLTSATPLLAATGENGSSLAGQVSVRHSFGEHIIADFGYQHLHENYGSIAVIAADPDSNRELVSISYQFRKPLGR